MYFVPPDLSIPATPLLCPFLSLLEFVKTSRPPFFFFVRKGFLSFVLLCNRFGPHLRPATLF